MPGASRARSLCVRCAGVGAVTLAGPGGRQPLACRAALYALPAARAGFSCHRTFGRPAENRNRHSSMRSHYANLCRNGEEVPRFACGAGVSHRCRAVQNVGHGIRARPSPPGRGRSAVSRSTYRGAQLLGRDGPGRSLGFFDVGRDGIDVHRVPEGRLNAWAVFQPSLRDSFPLGPNPPRLKRWAILGCPSGTSRSRGR